MNPVDEFFKEAGLWDVFKRGASGSMRAGGSKAGLGTAIVEGMGQALPGAIVGAGMTAGALGVSKGIGAISERFTKARDYKAMLQASPTLKKFDSGQVQMVYNSLRRQAPSLAKDPLIAGSFVHKTLDLAPETGPHIDPQTAKLLAETQRNLTQARGDRGGIADAFKPTQMFPISPDPFNAADRSQRGQQFTDQMGQRERHHKENLAEKLRR